MRPRNAPDEPVIIWLTAFFFNRFERTGRPFTIPAHLDIMSADPFTLGHIYLRADHQGRSHSHSGS